jgi:hypothetical protein
MNESTDNLRIVDDDSRTVPGSPIQLTSLGTRILASAAKVQVLRTQFAERQHVRLRNLIEPTLLERVAREIDRGAFHQRAHKKIGVELGMAADSLPVHLLRFSVNTSPLFKFVQQITECGRIGCFDGRIYRMLPVPDHYDSWHDDVMNHRKVGMSINLSVSGYEGGTFQLRDLTNGTEVHVPNIGFGDAILFQLGSHLKHRVTPVEGKLPKTAFAGWFCSEPDYLSLFRQQVSTRPGS